MTILIGKVRKRNPLHLSYGGKKTAEATDLSEYTVNRVLLDGSFFTSPNKRYKVENM